MALRDLVDLLVPSMPVGALVEERAGGLGPGRLLEINDSEALVEYFDHPGKGGKCTERIAIKGLRRAKLAPQTRVHVHTDGGWLHGRVFDHDLSAACVEVRMQGGETRILGEAEVVVRWNRRLPDATNLLANKWFESRRFHDARSGFVNAYLSRCSAYQGLTAFSSSSVERADHQLEAMRKILTDLTPRYLLADEVGLGKTIEAGMLIRQFLLDGNAGAVLVVVPPALVLQWQSELNGKLRLDAQYPDRCTVLSFDDVDGPLESDISLLVVDEAHRIAKHDDREARRRYERLKTLAGSAGGLLLLTATPLLQDAASLQRLLHLLSPAAYPLEGLPSFEAALEARDRIARSLGTLTDDSPAVFLRAAVVELRTALPEDNRLGELLDDVERCVGSGDEATKGQAVQVARSYVTEVHRLHSRMIRSRREAGLAEGFPVIGRSEPHQGSAVVDAEPVDVQVAFESWHEHVLAHIERSSGGDETAMAVSPIVEGLARAGDALRAACASRRAAQTRFGPIDAEEEELLASLEEAARARSIDCPRTRRGAELAADLARDGDYVAVAAGDDTVAAAIHEFVASRIGSGKVFRVGPDEPDAVDRFRKRAHGAVLVFGPAGEEGHNLQAANAVVHIDLPWDPNRLEQRLGRFDRFAKGLPAKQYVVEDERETLGNAWVYLLMNGFRIFTSSIASLQQAIEKMMPALVSVAVIEGPGALRGKADWVADQLDLELASVERAELLDETSLDDRGRRLLDSVDAAEEREAREAWRSAVIRWSSGDETGAADLRFRHTTPSAGEDRFALTRFDNPDPSRLNPKHMPLVPWTDMARRFSGAMEANLAAVGSFDRRIAAGRQLRLFGPGDPFIDALWAVADIEVQGRSFAVWRTRPEWSEAPLLALCFDFRVLPDLAGALEGSPAMRAKSPSTTSSVALRATSRRSSTVCGWGVRERRLMGTGL